MKKILIILPILIIQMTVKAQSIKQKDKYGKPIVYIDGLTLRSKDKYGTPLFYNDGQTI